MQRFWLFSSVAIQNKETLLSMNHIEIYLLDF